MSQSEGLFASVKALGTTLIGIVQTRLELLATEIEENRLLMVKQLCLGALAIFFLCLSVLLLTFLIIAIYWDSFRFQAIGLMALIYFVLAVVLVLYVVRKGSLRPKLFSVSIAELIKDRASLDSNQ
jgi:uncharacterized membrane protein YqjE